MEHIQLSSLFYMLLLLISIIQSQNSPNGDFVSSDLFVSSYKESVKDLLSKRLNGMLSTIEVVDNSILRCLKSH